MNEKELMDAVSRAVDEVAKRSGIEFAACQKSNVRFVSDKEDFMKLEITAEYVCGRFGINGKRARRMTYSVAAADADGEAVSSK